MLWIGIVLAYLLACSWIHTLQRNGNWTSTKTSLEKGVMGAWSFMLTHRALANSHLDLGTWHGFQEVFYHQPIQYQQLQFDFKLAENSCLICYYAGKSDTLFAVRISNHPVYVPATLTIVNSAFIKKTPIHLSDLKADWNTFSISNLHDTLILSLNHGIGLKVPIPSDITTNRIGFRGYENPVWIDNIVATDPNGKALFREKFRMPFPHWPVIILLILCANLLYLFLPRLRPLLLIAVVNISLILTFIALFYFFRGQNLYPQEWMINWQQKTTTIETKAEANKAIEGKMKGWKQTGKTMIMFLGTSQTWGAGATTENMAFTERFCQMANQNENLNVTCINTGISGINSDTIISYYQNLWIQHEPDICIINLSVNDAGNPRFAANLERITDINRSSGITTVLIPEPIYGSVKEITLNHKIIAYLAAKNQLPLIDVSVHLQKHADDGFLYWDFVHLTDFGHALFAEKLYQEISELLKETTSQNKSSCLPNH